MDSTMYDFLSYWHGCCVYIGGSLTYTLTPIAPAAQLHNVLICRANPNIGGLTMKITAVLTKAELVKAHIDTELLESNGCWYEQTNKAGDVTKAGVRCSAEFPSLHSMERFVADYDEKQLWDQTLGNGLVVGAQTAIRDSIMELLIGNPRIDSDTLQAGVITACESHRFDAPRKMSVRMSKAETEKAFLDKMLKAGNITPETAERILAEM
jgi:hypothetical protein